MKRLLFVAALVAAAVAASVAGPAKAHRATAPGPWCGGTLWKLMTLSDSRRSAVNLSPAATSIADIAKLPTPARITAARTTAFQKQNWQLTAVVDNYRTATNGEIVLVLFDTKTSTYMDAYLENPSCLSSATRARAQILAARDDFTKACQTPPASWQPLGTTVQLSGVGFWNPSKATKGALPNGAELRPVTGITIMQGCGHF